MTAAPYSCASAIAARKILQSKNAFNGGIETLSVERYVVNSERFQEEANETERDKARRRVITTIIEGNEGTSVTADAWDLMAFMYSCTVSNVLQCGCSPIRRRTVRRCGARLLPRIH